LFDNWHVNCCSEFKFLLRFDMKDTFNASNSPDKVDHFIFECEIFDKSDELVNSREIQIEIAHSELLLPELNLY